MVICLLVTTFPVGMIEHPCIPGNLSYTWTSGRLCDFDGCDRPDLQPVVINGWFWTGSNKKIAPTNRVPKDWDYKPWSSTGHLKKDQPDNAEFGINK